MNEFHTVRSFQIAGIVLQFGSIVSNCRNFPTIWSNPYLSNRRNFPTIWSNPQKKFTLFKSYNLPKIWFNHSNFLAHIFKIVGIFLQFGSLHIFQSVGIFLQFSSIHIFQIFLQFGPIHIINSLFSNRIIFLQFGLIISNSLHTFIKL